MTYDPPLASGCWVQMIIMERAFGQLIVTFSAGLQYKLNN